MTGFQIDVLDRMANHLHTGRALFFIGAGFSLDSEQNSSARLIGRLLSRFIGILRLGKQPTFLPDLPKDFAETSQQMASTFVKLFGAKFHADFNFDDFHAKLQPSATSKAEMQALHNRYLRQSQQPMDQDLLIQRLLDKSNTTPFSWADLKRLEPEYYVFNDWIANVFGHLFFTILSAKDLDLSTLQELLTKLNPDEEEIKTKVDPDCPKLLPLNANLIWNLRGEGPQALGKVVFLETMGFSCNQTMASDYNHNSYSDVESAYQDRLLPRYQVLGRFAREGMTSPLITTNFDTLLETGLRSAGLNCAHQNLPQQNDLLPKTQIHKLHMVSDPRDFIEGQYQNDAGKVVKIHGCVKRYRNLRANLVGKHPPIKAALDEFVDYLKAIVFTYREIQHWREDNWSRDYLNHLLRTRTLIFTSYSAMDPVIHGTFRSIYEELARYQKQSKDSTEMQKPNAFFLEFGKGTINFHGLEILRAATKAHLENHATPSPLDHEHYLNFLPRDAKQTFPNIDQLMRLLLHLALRQRQKAALESELFRLSRSLFSHPAKQSDVERIQARFDQLLNAERDAINEHCCQQQNHPFLDAVVFWTESFMTALMREYALSEWSARGGGLTRHREWHRPDWYFPTTSHGDWVAWSVLVELAVRQMMAQRFKSAKPTLDWCAWNLLLPTRAIAGEASPVLPLKRPQGGLHLLRIQVDYHLQDMRPILASSEHRWLLSPKTIPWQPKGNTPSKLKIWQAALGQWVDDSNYLGF